MEARSVVAGEGKVADVESSVVRRGLSLKSNGGIDPRIRWLFWSILFLGAFIRFFWLGRASYMIDEINVVRDAATQPSYAAIFDTELGRFSWYHRLPLLMFIMRFVFQMIGYTSNFPPEWLARMPFAILGTLSLPLFYLLGLSLRNRALGLWCMFLAAISVFHSFYSREAYDYSMVIFFAVGTLWSGVELVRCDFAEVKAGPWRVLAYLFFSIGMLQSHLSGLLFLGPLNVLMFFVLFFSPGKMRGKQIGRWLVLMGAAYVVFFPFLLRLFGGFEVTEQPTVKRFSLAVVPALLGRMGWGEFWWTLVPFGVFLVAGFVGIRLARDRTERFLWILLAVELLAYFFVQSWMLRVSRFEVRYYSALFPLLILFVAWGVESTIEWFRAKNPRISVAKLKTIVAMVILFWLAPSLWNVCALQTRGYNYKGIAAWINQNITTNGTYSFFNVYELRGVPNTYPTPGRNATSVGAWSTAEDYQRVQPPKRMVSLFTRFPQIVFVEIAPDDLLAPELKADSLPRDQLFMRHEWLVDPAWDRLLQLRTFPLSEVQLNATNISRTLISWNEPEDLPKLAAKNGRLFYHSFGVGWQYVRDQQMNDWMVMQNSIMGAASATLNVGNVTEHACTADLVLDVMAPPNGCRWSLYDPSGRVLMDKTLISAQPQSLTIRNLVIPPGGAMLTLQTLPPPNDVNWNFCVYAVKLTNSKLADPAIPSSQP